MSNFDQIFDKTLPKYTFSIFTKATIRKKLQDRPKARQDLSLESFQKKAYQDFFLQFQLLREKGYQLERGSSAKQAAAALTNAIEKAFIEQLIEPDEPNIAQFKQASQAAIQTAKESELANHRGYKEAFINLGVLLATLGTMIVPILCTRGWTGRWFFEVNTDSINKVEQLEEALESINLEN